MTEPENPRNDRRRSSRGRRRRSGGGERAPQEQQNGGGGQQKAAANQPRSAKAPKPQEKQGRGRDRSGRKGENQKNGNGQRNSGRSEAGKSSQPAVQRERYAAPRIVPPTLPKPICPKCGKPIDDLPAAMNDKSTGEPMHFDCVLERIAESESLAEGEKVAYLGGGRFGILQFEHPGDAKHFRVKKMVQWEEKDKRAEWRRHVAELYSTT